MNSTQNVRGKQISLQCLRKTIRSGLTGSEKTLLELLFSGGKLTTTIMDDDDDDDVLARVVDCYLTETAAGYYCMAD